jgi:uncharacterized protein
LAIIIDGYNVLHAAGLLGAAVAPGGLERARLALLNFLVESLDPVEIPRTTIVFDAGRPPWGAPRMLRHRGLTVCFAANYDNADELIEELIRHDSAPRRLTVVSSDHRLRQAAHRRKAVSIDSETWYAELIEQRRQRRQSHGEKPKTPDHHLVPLLTEDVDYWINQFGGEELLQEWLDHEKAAGSRDRDRNKSATDSSDPDGCKAATSGRDPDGDKDVNGLENPFPPGYGEDLLTDENV